MSILFMQVSKISYRSSQYPALLREIASPPKQLFVLGELPQGPAIAIVGTRKQTSYGKQATYMLATELAQAGFTIVSGLAYGVDATAHQAALEAGGKTVAVLGHSLDMIYPSKHRNLAKEILAKRGALVSEYPATTHPT